MGLLPGGKRLLHLGLFLIVVGLFQSDAIGMWGSEGGNATDPDSAIVRMICLGDVNLGRHVGQVILRGDTLYPLRHLRDTLQTYDIVFANLESNLSDQNGLTEDPKSNTVFTGPPAGARSLRLGGVTVVSTANNHALDFGANAAVQTCSFLDREGIAHAGTSRDSANVYHPTFLQSHGIRFALFACTEFINGTRDDTWRRWVAAADTGRLFPAIRAVRDSVDIVVVSIHGGIEYGRKPTPEIIAFSHEAIDAGANIVLGHHPHVPYALATWHNGIIAPSLGNCVFKQPFEYWTQRSYALSLEFSRKGSRDLGIAVRCLPLRADYQPWFLPQGPEYQTVMDHIGSISTIVYVKRRS